MDLDLQAERQQISRKGVRDLMGSVAVVHALHDEACADTALLDAYLTNGITDIISVPCSITASWQSLAAESARRGAVRLTMTNHEGNLVGIAAGAWFGSGRPALVHMQNSGLLNAGDGFISLADPTVYAIPLTALVTVRGATPADDSEPHQSIGRRTDALVRAVFGEAAQVFGGRSGRSVRNGAERAVAAASDGGISVLTLHPEAIRRTVEPALAAAFPACGRDERAALRASRGASSMPAALRASHPISREEAIRAIAALHPSAAILFCNGYTSRTARAICDRPGNFYNVGYMGGTLAIGWGLARSRPDLEVVVVDGDQNAMMSAMKDHLCAGYPANLHWYILNNHIGASVGTALSVPLGDGYHDLARVIETKPDAPGEFAHPRVSAPARTPGERPPLAALARRFRRWIDQR